MTNELKPCPFCGSDRIALDEEYNEIIKEPMYRVECWNCGGTGCDTYDKDKAIKAWNQRAIE